MLKTKQIISLIIVAFIMFYIILIPTEVTFAASKIKLSKTSAVVTEGDYLYLHMKGTKKKATWTSSNKYRATVSKNGKVTTNGTGKVTITAKIGKSKYTCKVVIIPNIDPNYKTDRDVENALAERDYLDNFGSDSDFTIVFEDPKESKEVKNKTDKDKISSKVNDSEENWITTDDLDTYYKLFPSWTGYEILLVDRQTNKIILTDAPASKFEKDVIYECKYGDYIIRCYYSFVGNQIIFNLDDLKNAGIVE